MPLKHTHAHSQEGKDNTQRVNSKATMTIINSTCHSLQRRIAIKTSWLTMFHTWITTEMGKKGLFGKISVEEILKHDSWREKN